MRSFLLLTLFVSVASAFTNIQSDRRTISFGAKQNFPQQKLETTAIFSSPSPSEEETSWDDKGGKSATPLTTAAVSEPETETKYPINLPSPLLLSASMILGIAGTGSSFELAGGSPTLGFGTTAAIAAVSIPLSLFLFYASILKATAETEADDAEFMKGKY